MGRPLAALARWRHPACASAEGLLQCQAEVHVAVAFPEFVDDGRRRGAVRAEDRAMAIARRVESIVEVERDRRSIAWAIFDKCRSIWAGV